MWLFRYHLEFLPFHNHIMNCVRGGFLLAFAWVSGCSASLLIWIFTQNKDYKALDAASAEQAIMWAILGCSIPVFGFGLTLVHWRRKGLYEIMITLYGEYQAEQKAHISAMEVTYICITPVHIVAPPTLNTIAEAKSRTPASEFTHSHAELSASCRLGWFCGSCLLSRDASR